MFNWVVGWFRFNILVKNIRCAAFLCSDCPLQVESHYCRLSFPSAMRPRIRLVVSALISCRDLCPLYNLMEVNGTWLALLTVLKTVFLKEFFSQFGLLKGKPADKSPNPSNSHQNNPTGKTKVKRKLHCAVEYWDFHLIKLRYDNIPI